MLAKQDTPMKARRTVLGRVPARLSTRVIRTRSMFVLLRADAIVNPPMSSMIVGENICEKTKLHEVNLKLLRLLRITKRAYCVASGLDKVFPPESRMTLNITSSSGTRIEVTKRGMA